MSMPKSLLPLLCSVAVTSCTTATSQNARVPYARLDIGHLATAQEINGWDIDIRPDGQGLPSGAGTVAEGRAIYAAQCSACHGANGEGGAAAALVGGIGSLNGKVPVRTVGSFWPYAPTIYDYVYRSMPWDKPQSLTPNDVYAVTAYLLNANGVIAEETVMNATSLPAVRMPNRNGFIAAPDVPDIKVPRCMSNC